MAKPHGQKSDAIREVLTAQPTATVKEIQAALGAKRIKASVALVSRLKAVANGKRRARKLHANGKANGVTLDNLIAAKGLVAKVGSVEAARAALDSLAKLIKA